MAKSDITIKIESSNILEQSKAEKNLQMLCDRLQAGGVNKLCDMLKGPKKAVVEIFLKSNGI